MITSTYEQQSDKIIITNNSFPGKVGKQGKHLCYIESKSVLNSIFCHNADKMYD